MLKTDFVKRSFVLWGLSVEREDLFISFFLL